MQKKIEQNILLQNFYEDSNFCNIDYFKSILVDINTSFSNHIS